MHEKCLEGTTAQAASLPTPPPLPQLTSEERMQRWEEGQIDYMGADSFDNIEQKLNLFLK